MLRQNIPIQLVPSLCSRRLAVGKRRVPIEDADVVEAEKTALENIVALGIFTIHPPGESDEQFVENCFEKCTIAFAGLLSLNLVNAPRRPRRSPAD